MTERQAVAALLRAARKIIEEPKHWTQGQSAADAAGKGVGIEHESAVCFCAAGAINRARWNTLCRLRTLDDACSRMAETARLMGYSSFTSLNDCTNHTTVLDAFDRTIQRIEAEPDPESQEEVTPHVVWGAADRV